MDASGVLFIIIAASQIGLYILMYKNIKRYEENNHNYISKELKKVGQVFKGETEKIRSDVNIFTNQSSKSFQNMSEQNEQFLINQQKEFKKVTDYMRNDYNSLSLALESTNKMLEILLEEVQVNITKNNELRPIVVGSYKELEKVYGKIKLLTTNYEKNLEDLKDDVKDSLETIDNILDSKLRRLANRGEKIMSESVETSKMTIEKVTNETNSGLRKVLQDNQITLLSENMKISNEDLAACCQALREDVRMLNKKLTKKLNNLEKEQTKNRSIWAGIQSWWDK